MDCAHGNLGSVLSYTGEFDKAIEAYREAIRLDRTTAVYHSRIAVALAMTGAADDAIASLQRAGELDESPVEMLQKLDLIAAHRGDPSYLAMAERMRANK